jgi:hypothetical protein
MRCVIADNGNPNTADKCLILDTEENHLTSLGAVKVPIAILKFTVEVDQVFFVSHDASPTRWL